MLIVVVLIVVAAPRLREDPARTSIRNSHVVQGRRLQPQLPGLPGLPELLLLLILLLKLLLLLLLLLLLILLLLLLLLLLLRLLLPNLGPEGRSYICSGTVSWKEFLTNG